MGDDGPDGDQGENGDPGSAGDPVRLTDHHRYILKNCKYLNYLMNHVPLFKSNICRESWEWKETKV